MARPPAQKEAYLLELAPFLLLNPARACMVREAADWAWSNYRATAGAVPVPDWLETDRILDAERAGQISHRCTPCTDTS
jgi:putative transposase